jgi:hypothetical protein
MKKGLKVVALSALTALALGSAASTLILINDTLRTSVDTGTTIDGDGLNEHQTEVNNIKAALFENLGQSNLNFNKLTLKAVDLASTTKELDLSYKGSLDYLAYVQTDLDTDESNNAPAKFSGDVDINVKDNGVVDDGTGESKENLSQQLSVASNGTGKLFLRVVNDEYDDTQSYQVSGKVINDLIAFIPKLQEYGLLSENIPDVSNIAKQLSKIDVAVLLPMVVNAAGSFFDTLDLDQEPENGTYTFHLTIPASLLESVGINQDIKFNLSCDSNGLLTALELEEININGTKVSLSGDAEMSIDSEFTTEVDESEYTNNLDCTTNLLTTIGSLVDEKKFATDFTLTLNESKDGSKIASHEFVGTAKGDLSANASFTEGAIYDLSIDQSKDFNNQLNVHYQDNTTYFKFNELVKGYLENTTVESLIDDVATTTNSTTASDGSDAVNDVLKDTAIYEIMDGNRSAYKKIIKSLTIVDEKMTLTINAKEFNLPDGFFTIDIDLSGGKLNSLSVKDLPFREVTKTDGFTYLDTVDFNLTLADYETLEFDSAGYTNFRVVSPIYNTISKIMNSEQVGLDYSLKYTKKDENSPFVTVNGKIDGDLSASSIDFAEFDTSDAIASIENEDLGNYQVTAQTEVNDIPHNLKMNYQDEALYMQYQGQTEKSLTKLSLTQGKLFNLYDVINGVLNSDVDTTTDGSASTDGDINSMLEDLLDVTNGDIWDILKGDDIKDLENAISITGETDDGLARVEIDTSKLFDTDYGTITMLFDTVTQGESQLLSLGTTYTTLDYGTVDLTLTFRDYDTLATLDEGTIANYKSFDNSIDALINILNGSTSSTEVNGSLANSFRN